MTPRLAALVRSNSSAPNGGRLPGEDAFRFRHLLIRDAAYEALPKAARLIFTSGSQPGWKKTAGNWPSSTSCRATTSSRPTSTESS